MMTLGKRAARKDILSVFDYCQARNGLETKDWSTPEFSAKP